MKRAILLCAAILLIAVSALAAPVTLTREYTYKASDADSKLSSRSIALEQVKRLLLEELGTYLISNTIVHNAQLSKDEIITYSAGAVVTVILDEKWDGTTYQLKAKLTADPDDVARALAVIKNDRERATELEQLRKQASDSLKEVERLNKELALSKGAAKTATTQERTRELQNKYKETTGELAAKEYLEQGISLLNENKPDRAVEAYSKAIELAPKWARPYAGRGAAYVRMNDFTRGEPDLNHARKLDPKNMFALSLHGVSLMQQGRTRDGMIEIERAVQANPEDVAINTSMGWALLQVNQPRKAIPFLTKAIELSRQKNSRAYLFRAKAFRELGEHVKAKADMASAEALGAIPSSRERDEHRRPPQRMRP